MLFNFQKKKNPFWSIWVILNHIDIGQDFCMIYSNDLFEVLHSMGQMGKLSLWCWWVIWIKLSQICAILCLMIRSRDICEIL